MQKIKFDFEATKERIYAPNSNVPIGAPVDRNGNIANDGNAYGIVLCKETENEKYWVRYNLVVMVAGYCDIIDAQEIWGDEYSAEAIAAMSDIIFCDDHKIGGGGGWPADLPKPSVGGYGYTEQGEQTTITWDGDTEGRDSFTIYDQYGGYTFYKVAEKGTGYTDNAAVTYYMGDTPSDAQFLSCENASAYLDDMFPVVIVADGGEFTIQSGDDAFTSVAPSSGVYFQLWQVGDSSRYITSLTYGTPDTVHKIDEKYLPASGGDFIIHVTEDDDGNLVADKTYKEVFEARNNGMAVKAIYRWAVYPINSYYNSGGFSGQFIPIDVAGNLMYVFTLKFGFDDNDNPQITHNQTSYTLTAST